MVEYVDFTMPKTDSEEWSALGVSYTRFSTLHGAMYTGIDETAIYSSKWSAIVERDTRHDLDTWNPSSADHHLERCRFWRNYPANSSSIVINSVEQVGRAIAREDYYLARFHFPVQRRPAVCRGHTRPPPPDRSPWRTQGARSASVSFSVFSY